MNSCLYAGLHWDLTVPYLDCTGVEWHHTGIRSARGFPMMQSDVPELAPVLLNEVHEWHGPLIPLAPVPPRRSAWLTHPIALPAVAA